MTALYNCPKCGCAMEPPTVEVGPNWKEVAETYRSMLGSQQRHQQMCYEIFKAAKDKGLIYGLGACGNGGVPTFEAIVNKCVEAINAIPQHD